LGYIVRSHELLDQIAKLRGLDASGSGRATYVAVRL
jgi:hypothetical protein